MRCDAINRHLSSMIQRALALINSLLFPPKQTNRTMNNKLTTRKTQPQKKGPTRRPNLPLRTELPRRNHRREHHQRIRQLHQRLLEHGGQCRLALVHRRRRRWQQHKAQGAGDGCGSRLFAEFGGVYARMFGTQVVMINGTNDANEFCEQDSTPSSSQTTPSHCTHTNIHVQRLDWETKRRHGFGIRKCKGGIFVQEQEEIEQQRQQR